MKDEMTAKEFSIAVAKIFTDHCRKKADPEFMERLDYLDKLTEEAVGVVPEKEMLKHTEEFTDSWYYCSCETPDKSGFGFSCAECNRPIKDK